MTPQQVMHALDIYREAVHAYYVMLRLTNEKREDWQRISAMYVDAGKSKKARLQPELMATWYELRGCTELEHSLDVKQQTAANELMTALRVLGQQMGETVPAWMRLGNDSSESL